MRSSTDQAKRQASGRSSEELVAALNARCDTACVARLWRLFPECRGAPGKMRPIAKAPCDFAGYMLDGTARCVLVEVKHTKSKTLRCDALEPHQWAALQACDQSGGVAVVLVVSAGQAWAVDFEAFYNERTLLAIEGGVVDYKLRGLLASGSVPYLSYWSGK